ncbi:MAG: hypothetical protein AB1558_10870 [Thermodesulfobacteriota bacterium]
MNDTIVIGRDLSSLIAALTSSRLGFKTILISEGGCRAEHREAGYAFPVDPTPLSGYGDGQTVAHLLRALDLEPEEAPQPLLVDPAIQVILSNHRIDLFHEPEPLIRELIREFPQSAGEIRRLYDSVDRAKGMIESWIGEDHARPKRGLGTTLRGLIRLPAALTGRLSLSNGGGEESRALIRVIEAQLTVLSHLHTDAARLPLCAGYILSLPQRGIFYPAGGPTAWINWLRDRFTESGGVMLDDCSVIRIDTKPDVAIDLTVPGGSTTLQARHLIVSAQWEKLKPLLLQQRACRRLAAKLASVPPAAHPFCLHLGVHSGGLPDQLAPYALWVRDASKPIMDQNLVFIQTSRPDDLERAPKGKRALCATAYLGKSPTMLTDQELSGVAKSIIDSLEGLLPFLRESIDYVNIETSIALSRDSHEIVNQKYHAPAGLVIGMETLSPDTSLPNVFLTGGILRAGLGFEGEILSGMDAAFRAGRERKHDG